MQKMLRVAYDYQIFSLQAYGGISRYFSALATSLADTGLIAPKIIAPLHINDYLPSLRPGLVLGRHRGSRRRSKKLERAVNRLLFGLETKIHRPSVVHETYYLAPAAPHRSAPVVTTVHDMIHERYPNHFHAGDRTSENKRRCVAAADHVICVSENTKVDLIELFGVPERKISVVYHGVQAPNKRSSENRGDTALTMAPCRPYVLFVGQRKGYKNFSALVEAMSGLRGPASELGLVCFGGGAIDGTEEMQIREAGLARQRVHQIDGDDAVLETLYQSAVCLVYPSLYEGFGMPIVEAMSAGCPVACSATSAMPEVGGDAVLYFDPKVSESIRFVLTKIAESPQLRVKLSKLGRDRSRSFSWQESARRTFGVYRKVI